MVLSFGTHDIANLNPNYAKQEIYDSFTKYCADRLDYPVISNLGTYIMENKYMYNSQWHCNTEGAEKRTRDLANDLINYFNGIYQ